MELNENLFETTDENGNYVSNTMNDDIAVLINGKDRGFKLPDFFVKHRFYRKGIDGYSLFQFFKEQDGALVDKEGNRITLFVVNKNLPLKFKSHDVPTITLDPVNVLQKYVKAISSAIGIEKPEEAFPSMPDEEKKVFIQERETTIQEAAANRTAQQQAEADEIAKADAVIDAISKTENKDDLKPEAGIPLFDQIHSLNQTLLPEGKQHKDLEHLMSKRIEAIDEQIQNAEETKKQKAEQTKQAKIKKDQELRAKVSDPQFIVEESKYKETKRFFEEDIEGWKERILDNVHFFYGANHNEQKEVPFILIKRGDNWWEEVETLSFGEGDKLFTIDYLDNEETKTLTFDKEADTISVAKPNVSAKETV